MNRLGRKIFGGTLAAGMAAAGYWSLRLAYADHLGQSDAPASVHRALRWAPGNAEYWLHWADLEEAAGRSGSPGLQQAAGADPYAPTVWIRAGLDAEMNGDFARAEQDLLRAARRSRQFEPRWTLANYYFRRGDAAHFWPWAKSAIQWAYTDRSLLFDLCWKMEANPQVILDQAIPNDPKVLRQYLRFLIANNQPEASVAVARRIEPVASDSDRTLLLGYADWLMAHRRWEDALDSWNALCLRRLVDYRTIDAASGRFITNGEFAAHPLNSGFDWRIPSISGVSAVFNDSPRWVRFDFSGDQPEFIRFLYQFVPMAPGDRYLLRYTFRTEHIDPQSGLRWRITDAAGDQQIAIEGTSLSSGNWATSTLQFTAPAGIHTGRITLGYSRLPGTVTIQGSVWLKNVKLERLP